MLIDATALLHNVRRVRQCAPGKKIIAMVKANAYGCGLSSVVPVLDGHVDAFGVACLEEALTLRALGNRSPCVLFQGIFNADELQQVVAHQLDCVIHQALQLQWIINTPIATKIKVWVKVNTGMNRLGFSPHEVADVISALINCPWVDKNIGLMTHLASADEPNQVNNQSQSRTFYSLVFPNTQLTRSIANSAAILALNDTQSDVVRPGLMLYGVSPFADTVGLDLGLIPVMRFISAITAVRDYPPDVSIGYGGTWTRPWPTRIGIVPVGYGDGYPRHLSAPTVVWINGFLAPIVGRISMDMLTIDLTSCPDATIGDGVELWGIHVPVEAVARAAGTTGYELLCQLSPRVRDPRLNYG